MDGLNPLPTPAFRDTKAQHVAVGVLAAALLALGIYTLRNFLSALVWAGIFAIALWPFYRRVTARFGVGKHNVLWPMLFTLGVALVFIVPVGLIAMQLARELHAAGEWVRNVAVRTASSRARTSCTACHSASRSSMNGGSRTWRIAGKAPSSWCERTSHAPATP